MKVITKRSQTISKLPIMAKKDTAAEAAAEKFGTDGVDVHDAQGRYVRTYAAKKLKGFQHVHGEDFMASAEEFISHNPGYSLKKTKFKTEDDE